MRALIQRVGQASVTVDGELVGSCNKGLLILLGVGADDTSQNAIQLWNKIYRLRIFADEDEKTNLSLADIDGEVLVVSQFTLFADCKKGNRPSFTQAAPQEKGRRLYEEFCALAERDVRNVGRGVFGANMQVSLTNDGPFTVWLER
ncbi:MAG: D-aminoacyl-tRNA deacylase [Coriobacteriales bacterium]|nr:D-aminoacyl-tRNA deacylase [Coriobacteriales bacterium]